jgi:hypothetical protein
VKFGIAAEIQPSGAGNADKSRDTPLTPLRWAVAKRGGYGTNCNPESIRTCPSRKIDSRYRL